MSRALSRRLAVAAGAACVCCALAPVPGRAQTTRLIPIRRIETARGRPAAAPHRTVLPGEAAARLRSRPARLGRAPAPARLLPGLPPPPALPDTVRVLVLRLEFAPDDDPLTTGDGTFDLRPLETFAAEEGHEIDAAPHDRGFAARHLRALHHYWWAMSGGRLSLTADIFPSADTLAYRLPRPMSEYGFRSTLGDILTAIETLVDDAVGAAATGTDPIAWDGYEAVVLLHAGADWQGDLNGDTPADLPTAWVSLGSPVTVDGTGIGEVIIVPETVSQDGFVGAINGVFAHEFGHQLGLPDLYDTVSMSPAVGLWALMDTGAETGGVLDDLYVWGVLPASLSSWARLWLGWTVPAVLGPGGETVLAASTALDGIHNAPAAPHLALVPAGEDQAFLVELRADDLDGDPGVSLFWDGGVIDGTARLVGDEKVRTYEYDALLPAGGVLIWHLDSAVAAADPDGDGSTRFSANTLQADRLRRFLDIEEADGLQELGWVPGYLGSETDVWLADPSGPSLFGPFTRPSSASWTGAFTGLELTIHDHPSPLAVILRVNVRSAFPSWSAPLPGRGSAVSVPWLIDADLDGRPVVAVLDSAGGLHLFDSDGAPRAANPVWTAPEVPAAPLSLAGTSFVVAAGTSLFWLTEDGSEDAVVELGRRAAGRPVGFPGTSGGPGVLVPLEQGRVVEADRNGIIDTWVLGAEVGALLYAPPFTGRLAAAGGVLSALEPGGGSVPLWTGGTDLTCLSLGAWDTGTGTGTIGLLDGGGQLTVLRLAAGGVSAVVLRTVALDEPRGPISLLPLPGPDAPAFVVPTAGGVRAFDAAGHPLADWPPDPGGRAAVTPPLPVGPLLSLSDGVSCSLTDAAELLFLDRCARPLFGGARILPAAPAAAPSIGGGGGVQYPVLLLADRDSLRVLALSLAELRGLSPVWAGPEGGVTGRGAPQGYLDSLPVLDDAWVTDFYVYPNPVRRECRLRTEGIEGEITFLAWTSVGTFVGEIGTLSAHGGIAELPWEVSDLSPGVYRVVAEVREGSGSGGVRHRYAFTVMVVR